MTSPCHHCSVKPPLLFFKKKQKSSLNKHRGKNSHSEILVILSFHLFPLAHRAAFQLVTAGIFSLLCSSLKNMYLFGNAAFQVNAMIIHTVEFIVAVQKCPYFTILCTHLASHWREHSTVLGAGGGGWGRAHGRSWPSGSACPAPASRTRRGVGKHSTKISV